MANINLINSANNILDRILTDWAANEYAKTTGNEWYEDRGMYTDEQALDIELDTHGDELIGLKWIITDTEGNKLAEDSASLGSDYDDDGYLIDYQDDEGNLTAAGEHEIQNIIDDYIAPDWESAKEYLESQDN